MSFKTETERPKIADDFQEQFGVNYDDGTLIIANNGKIYCKKGEISDDLYVHELTHLVQEKEYGKINSFWGKYLTDPEFRIEKEAEAYRNQLKFVSNYVKDKNRLYRFRVDLCRQLASSMYGNVIDTTRALELIKI